MGQAPLSTIGLVMPPGFPSEDYDAVNSAVSRHQSHHPSEVSQFVGGWLGVAYRFLSCTDYDAAFRSSVSRPGGDAPPHPERYKQEKWLFGFFATGLSTLESLCYGLFAVGAITRPKDFRFVGPSDWRRVTPSWTRRQFASAFPQHSLTNMLEELMGSRKFHEWNEVRNILVHRSAPGRTISGTTSSAHQRRPALWVQGITLDERTTTFRRNWLAQQLSQLMSAARRFAEVHL
jgi:hypothetical protein